MIYNTAIWDVLAPGGERVEVESVSLRVPDVRVPN